MSSASLASADEAVYAAWETNNQIEFAKISSPLRPISPSGTGKRRLPSVATNTRGAVLLAWTENTGWAKGGSLAWQLFSPEGKPLGNRESVQGVPVWSLVSAVALPDNSFAVVY